MFGFGDSVLDWWAPAMSPAASSSLQLEANRSDSSLAPINFGLFRFNGPGILSRGNLELRCVDRVEG